MFFLSVWNCKEEDWTLNFNALQLANISINPFTYLNSELRKVLKGHLEQKGHNAGYQTAPSFIDVFGNSSNKIKNSRINMKNSKYQESFASYQKII